MPLVHVPPQRVSRWTENFATRHGAARLAVRDGALRGEADDGSWFEARLPFGAAYDGPPNADALAAVAVPPDRWGVLLVRKGGFAVARLEGDRLVAHKVGRRHVQGRTKAGGQSQQRFARRRQNQARVAYAAAADHAAGILTGRALPVVAGGDRTAVAEVLADPRLRDVAVTGEWLAVAEPRRAVLDEAIEHARAVAVTVHNAEPG